MTINLTKLFEQATKKGYSSEAIDTSALYEELRWEYTKAGKAVEVNFRQLVNWLRLGDQLTHQIHPYPAKLLPHIAHFFARASILHGRNRIVLDPFCGSGTVALEASLAGYTPYIADANPLALLLAKVKTKPYDTDALREAGRKILIKASRFKTAPAIDIINEHLWYSVEHKRALEIILRALQEIEDVDQQDFFKVCFSVTARRVSFADPAVSVPVRLRTKQQRTSAANEKIESRLKWINDVSPLEEFKKVFEANIRRVEETNEIFPKRKQAVHIGNDARKLKQPGSMKKPLKNDSIPLIVTSPPYGSAQKYVRASSLSLNWLGLVPPKQLSEFEGKSIGREHMPHHREPAEQGESLSKRYEKLIKTISGVNELRGLITRRYLCEMRNVVAEITRVTAPSGRVVFVIGNNQVCGQVLRNDDYLIECFNQNGMQLELGLVDHIKSRGLMTKRNRTASVISREAVLVFKKEK